MKTELTYHEGADGMMYPDLALPEQKNYPIGKYGDLRLDFIKKHRRGTYSLLVGECRLNEYLHDIDIQAKETVHTITAELAKSRGIDEKLKADDQLRWVAEMNNCKASAEEVVFRELIHR